MKLPVRCGVLDGGRRHMAPLGDIDRPGFPGPKWYRNGDYQRLRGEERDYVCPKHGAVQIHEEDILHEALKPGPPRRRHVILARSVRLNDLP